MTDSHTDEENNKKKKFSPISEAAGKIKDSSKTIVGKGIEKGKVISDKVTEKTIETVDKVDKTIRKVGQDISDELVKQSVNTGSKIAKSSRQSGTGMGNAFENQLFSWYGWFMSTVGYVILILLAFTISASDPSFALLPIIMVVGFPIFLFWMIYNIIPEISIGGKTIISRKQVSLRRQLSFGKAIARTFSREMWKNSPEMAIIIFIFLIILGFAILNPLLG